MCIQFKNYRGREGKGGRNRQQSQSSSDDDKNQSVETKDGNENGNKTEKSKKGRPKSPCEAIESEPYVNIEVVKYGRDPNNTFSSGNYSCNFFRLKYFYKNILLSFILYKKNYSI